ncbi:MAG: peptidylprolyl isomerase [Alphaproteobacteria bacterium]
MVKKDQKEKTTPAATHKKIGCLCHKPVLKKVVTVVLLGVTVFIWYKVGAVLFGLSHDEIFTRSEQNRMSDNTIVARIGGQDVHLQDVREYARNIPQLAELPFDMIYPQLLQSMIRSQVLLNAAENTGVENDAAVARALKLAREQVLSQAYLAKKLETQMNDEALQALYVEEMKNFERQEEIRARHILVATQKEAQDIIVQLKAGIDFGMLANEKSLDKDNLGGSLGYFTKNMMIPEFGDAVFMLKKGELSKPIKTPFGWHVVLVEDRRMSAPPAFEEVQDQLKQIYAERNVQRVVEEEMKNADVRILVPSL